VVCDNKGAVRERHCSKQAIIRPTKPYLCPRCCISEAEEQPPPQQQLACEGKIKSVCRTKSNLIGQQLACGRQVQGELLDTMQLDRTVSMHIYAVLTASCLLTSFLAALQQDICRQRSLDIPAGVCSCEGAEEFEYKQKSAQVC
jgi:hypothetical protein